MVTRSWRHNHLGVVGCSIQLPMGTSLLARLHARDRALFVRWATTPTAGWRRAWVTMTHIGGLWCTTAAAGLPLLAGGLVHVASRPGCMRTHDFHAIVQVIKRSVFRERPSIAIGTAALVANPDAFSFRRGTRRLQWLLPSPTRSRSPVGGATHASGRRSGPFARLSRCPLPRRRAGRPGIAVVTDLCLTRVM